MASGSGLKDRILKEPTPYFSQPVRQAVLMLIVTLLVGAGAYLAYGSIVSIFFSNPWLNGVIIGVFLLGVVTCFWQVAVLAQSVSWIEGFAAGRPGHEATVPPRLLAPLAALLRARGSRGQITTSSARSMLESVEDRIEEGRDITRYLSNLLIFLGLLGTFYGLATTVPAVVDTIRALAPAPGEDAMSVFDRLMSGLEAQLGGMGTAFSSSLLGLAGSLVVGLLELFASHGQNRFYRELEEWLSSITRLSFAGAEGEGGDHGVLTAAVGHLAEQMEMLQGLIAQGETGRLALDERLERLAGAMERIGARVEAGAALDERLEEVMTRLAEGQDRIAGGQAAMAEGQAATVEGLTIIAGYLRPRAEGQMDTAMPDAESRMRLRSIDVQLLRLLEEVAAGRQEAVAELRHDLAALTRAVRGLADPAQVAGRR
nr:biopolymer transporter ExbB [Frigidibacter oleivorans]